MQPDIVRNTANSFTVTTTPLGANQTTILGPIDCQKSDELAVIVYANEPGTLYVEISVSNSAWRLVDVIQVASTIPVNRAYSVTRRWMRLRYKNGGIAQSVFELGVARR